MFKFKSPLDFSFPFIYAFEFVCLLRLSVDCLKITRLSSKTAVGGAGEQLHSNYCRLLSLYLNIYQYNSINASNYPKDGLSSRETYKEESGRKR